MPTLVCTKKGMRRRYNSFKKAIVYLETTPSLLCLVILCRSHAFRGSIVIKDGPIVLESLRSRTSRAWYQFAKRTEMTLKDIGNKYAV